MQKGTTLLLGFYGGIISLPAYAYLDPGTGSVLLQVLVGGVLAAAFTLKTYWFKVKTFFKKLFRSE